LSPAGLITRASELIPLIHRYAAQPSEQRAVVEPAMWALEEVGLLSLLVPRRYGGHEANMRMTM
jgi:hypothetical protein